MQSLAKQQQKDHSFPPSSSGNNCTAAIPQFASDFARFQALRVQLGHLNKLVDVGLCLLAIACRDFDTLDSNFLNVLVRDKATNQAQCIPHSMTCPWCCCQAQGSPIWMTLLLSFTRTQRKDGRNHHCPSVHLARGAGCPQNCMVSDVPRGVSQH